MEHNNATYSTININALCEKDRVGFVGKDVPVPTPMDYSRENAEGRMARRIENWTPTVLID